MTKFEQVGVNLQYDAVSASHANKNFKYSCDTCCSKGMHIECDRCSIAVTHAMVVAYFESKQAMATNKKVRRGI